MTAIQFLKHLPTLPSCIFSHKNSLFLSPHFDLLSYTHITPLHVAPTIDLEKTPSDRQPIWKVCG